MAPAHSAVKRVLVVDDEEKFCHLVSGFLLGKGYEVATASTGTEAILQLDQFMPDVIVLDIHMPGLSGLEVLRLIKPRFNAPRIIVVTAYEPEDAGQETLQLGADAYMCKPIDLNQLEHVISGIWPATASPQAPSV